MKKLIVVTLISLMLVGCGKTETKEQNTEKSSVTQQTNTEKPTETEAFIEDEPKDEIDGFQNPDYDTYNSNASDNGLANTPVYIEGKVISQLKLSDTEPTIWAVIVEQKDGNRWCVGVPSDSEISGIAEKNIRVFGSYFGFSDVVNLPVIIMSAEDVEFLSKIRIEVEDNEDYIEIWNFYDNYYNEGIENEEDSQTEQPEDEDISSEYYESGQYKVGVDIEPGEYVFFADSSRGYFCVSSDANGDDIIANDNFDYNSIMKLKKGEYLELSRCYAVPIKEAKLEKEKATMLKVGEHIKAGEYKLKCDNSDKGYYCVYNDDR